MKLEESAWTLFEVIEENRMTLAKMQKIRGPGTKRAPKREHHHSPWGAHVTLRPAFLLMLCVCWNSRAVQLLWTRYHYIWPSNFCSQVPRSVN
jgi:hypothetical protein